MKSKIYAIILFLTGSLITACETDHLDHKNDFENSLITWEKFKETNNNTYEYKVTNSSWIGLSWETTLTVVNGEVTQRAFKYLQTKELKELDSRNIPQEDLEWVETGSNLGSHTNTSAAAVQTLNDIYTKAKNEWLIPRKSAKTYFKADNHGLISQCGYVNDNCIDDCFIGITIEYIKAL